MPGRWIVGTMVAMLFAVASRVDGIYIGAETRRVPVARLAGNLEQQLKSSPKDASLHVKLARLYGMAHAVNGEDLPVTTGKSGADELWFGHEPNLVPYRQKPGETRSEAARGYLKRAIEHYRMALDLEPDNQLARLGYGWSLQQAGDTPGAIAAYRAVIEKAWPKEQTVTMAQLGQRFYTLEAGEYLIPLLDPKSDAKEIAELRSRISKLQAVPRPITPIAIPLRDGATVVSIVDIDAQVRFDADGSGRQRRWTWISPDAGWLVYDAEKTGRISSALQWFGNATFWLFWTNGYEPLAALDDNNDGELAGEELRYLAVWHDRNRDGVSDRGEVRPLKEHRIVGLSCRFVAGDGLLVAAQSPNGVRFEDGRLRPTFDVILRPAWSVSAP